MNDFDARLAEIREAQRELLSQAECDQREMPVRDTWAVEKRAHTNIAWLLDHLAQREKRLMWLERIRDNARAFIFHQGQADAFKDSTIKWLSAEPKE